METVLLARESEECCEECVCSPISYSMYCVSHRACVGVHEYCLPLVSLLHLHVHCMLQFLSSYHLPVHPLDLDPLVDSLVTCQRLTSLKLTRVTLSLQSLLAVVKGLYNLRALGLEGVSLSDEKVSD